MRRPKRFYYLKRPKVRQSWNKVNLYNLSRLRIDRALPRLTFFQQKWYAKSLTRAYHGEHITEGKWERMFSRRLLSVVHMHPRYMAAHDGSEQAAGRGSGRDRPPQPPKRSSVERVLHELDEGAGVPPPLPDDGEDSSNLSRKAATKSPEQQKNTPYMQMVYAPQERRLDIAVFRALFASSARQARQMVVHGAVKVNGVKMPYPAYLLNPGDMFQVDVDHVLFATGQKKGEGSLDFPPIAPAPADPADEPDAGDAEPVASAAAPAEPSVARTERLNAGDVLRRLKQLNERARGMVVGAAGRAYSAKKKRAFRALIQDIKKAISSAGRQKKASEKARKGEGEGEGEDWQEEDDDDISNPVPALTAQLQAITLGDPAQAATAEQQDGAQDGAAEAAAAAPESVDSLTDEERAWFERLEAEENENPHDPTKRYHTPWQPRPYMSAFAFVPRYLEVNPTICAAVYLRHPVARQGEAEVPTPFPFNVNQLAFNWYLRRR